MTDQDPTYKRITVLIEDLATGKKQEAVFLKTMKGGMSITPIYDQPDFTKLTNDRITPQSHTVRRVDVVLSFSVVSEDRDAEFYVITENEND